MATFHRFACAIAGGVAIMAGHLSFGLDWMYSAFLFIPMFFLVQRFLANDGEGIVKFGSMLVLYPFVVLYVPPLVRLCLGKITQPGAKEDFAAVIIVTLLCISALQAVSFGVSVFFARCIGGFSMPVRVHAVLSKVLMLLAFVLTMACAVWAVHFLDSKVLALPFLLKFALYLMFVMGFAFAVRRVVAGRELVPVFNNSEGPKGSALRVDNRTDTRLSDVMGMENAKEQLRLRLIEPIRNPGRARKDGLKVGGGVRLYGPPGTGKTMLARAVAGELRLPFYMITSADVFGKYVGESEKNITHIFAEIRKNRLSVVFIDELETLFPKRTAEVHETTRKVIALLLQELDGLDSGKNPILLLGATNVPWMVDEAVLRPGRFDVKIFVDLPDKAARREMLVAAFAKGEIPHAPGLTEYMAERTKQYSGADLNGVMDKLRQHAYAHNAKCYTKDMADAAIAAVTPSANGSLLDQIHEWEADTMSDASGNSGGNGIRIAVRPTVKLADVAGMEEVKEQVRMRLIEPMRNAKLAQHYGIKVGGGIMLYGPPGTGKTFLAKAVAGELSLPFFAVTGADIFGKQIGESEKNVRRLFREIRKNDLSVVFIDELETIFPKRTSDVHESTRNVISLLLQELDGFDTMKNPILLLGATNVPWMVDEAFLRPGRFDMRIYVGPPDYDARKQMLHAALERGNVPYEEGLVEHLAECTVDFSGADISGLLERMKQAAFRSRYSYYTIDIANEILKSFHSSISSELVAQIKDWERTQC